MPARSSVLTLTDTAAPASRRKGRVVTPQTLAFQQLGQTWSGLSGVDKDSWETLSQQNTNAVQNGVPARAGGYAAFIGHNTPLMGASLPIQTVAPPRQDAPTLPAVTLHAVFGATPGTGLTVTLHAVFGATPGTGLTVTLTSPVPYQHRVLVYGARPMLASRGVYQTTRFLLLGSVATLGASTDLSALYTAKFRVLTPGYKVALHLVGVSPTGFRAAPLLVSAVAGTPDAAAKGPTLTLG